MPQVRLLAPWTDSKGQSQAAGAVIDVSDDEAKALTARGAASLIEEEKKLEEQSASSAVYDAKLQRPEAPGAPSSEAGQATPGGVQPGTEQQRPEVPPARSTEKPPTEEPPEPPVTRRR